jgi:predicted Zn-dependent protease
MEREADYVSLYIIAVAGYDYNAAPNFYRRLASADPGSIKKSFARTHPSSPERFIAMEKAVKEINDKKSKGLPLIPEEKPLPAPETVSPEGGNF